MSIDLAFYRRTDMLRRPIVVKTAAAIERRGGGGSGNVLNLLVGILFGTFILWLFAFVMFAI